MRTKEEVEQYLIELKEALTQWEYSGSEIGQRIVSTQIKTIEWVLNEIK